MQTQFQMGQSVLVLTTGLAEVWHDAKFIGHQTATATRREVYFFSNNRACFGVLAADLSTRVRIQ